MAIDVTESTFEREVIERSREVPVVVDFWAEWCGPCRTLTPALEKAAEQRAGKAELAKVDIDANQELARRFGIQGIPAVKAFRDGEVVAEFVGAQPPREVERFFDRLVPSEADELVAAGDEASLRRALELDPNRADAALTLARRLLADGDEDGALSLLEGREDDFGAAGIAARIRLGRAGVGTEAFEALDRGDRDRALEKLLAALDGADEETREELRRAIVGILSDGDPADPAAREYRRRLAAALY